MEEDVILKMEQDKVCTLYNHLFRVNIEKTEVMRCKVSKDQFFLTKTSIFPIQTRLF